MRTNCSSSSLSLCLSFMLSSSSVARRVIYHLQSESSSLTVDAQLNVALNAIPSPSHCLADAAHNETSSDEMRIPDKRNSSLDSLNKSTRAGWLPLTFIHSASVIYRAWLAFLIKMFCLCHPRSGVYLFPEPSGVFCS
jgi:hypothetical protein